MKAIEKSQKRAKCFKINQKYGKLALIDFVILPFFLDEKLVNHQRGIYRNPDNGFKINHNFRRRGCS